VKADSVHDFATIIRGRRHELGLTQAALADRAGVSRKWVHELEGGKLTAELGLVIRALHALGLEVDVRDTASSPGDRRGVDLDEILRRHGADG